MREGITGTYIYSSGLLSPIFQYSEVFSIISSRYALQVTQVNFFVVVVFANTELSVTYTPPKYKGFSRTVRLYKTMTLRSVWRWANPPVSRQDVLVEHDDKERTESVAESRKTAVKHA